jgi:hypothetical protein
MNTKQRHNRGLVQLIVLAVITMIILAYFKVDVRAFVDKVPLLKKFLNIFITAWGTYIKPLFIYFWTSISALMGK